MVNLYEKDHLNLEPGFQRKSVWKEKDRAKLIDSVIRNYPLPAILLFYRSEDERSVTSLEITEQYTTHDNADAIASLVKRRTVYSMDQIKKMATKSTRVILFRLIHHLKKPRTHRWLQQNGILKAAPQSIIRIPHDAFQKVVNND